MLEDFQKMVDKIKLRQNKTRSFENVVMSYFQRVRPESKVESFYTMSSQKKMMHPVLIAFVDTKTLCLTLWDVFIIIVPVKKLVVLSLGKKISYALEREC